MTTPVKVFVTQKIPSPAYSLLETVGTVDGERHTAMVLSPATLLQQAPAHDYLLSTTTDLIDSRLLEVCALQKPPLKLVANMAVGYNNIDLTTATRLGIIVTNTPGILSDTTADLAFALLLATARRIGEAERYLRAGRFAGWRPELLCGTDVHHATLGIIGAGRIGQVMARRALGFDMQVLYFNRHRLSSETETRYGLTYASFEEVLQQADFISIHAPYSKETHHLISTREFALMQPTAILINTARGPIVDEKALVLALKKGGIAAAGLDVFEQEPAIEPDLLHLENVVLLPHIGSASLQTRIQMAVMASQNIVAHASGQRPPHVVNPDVYI